MHLYFHVPFCARRCSYCDFAIAVRRETPSTEYVEAVAQEWAGWQSHPIWAESPVVDTIYFGGGTPSRLDPEELGRLLEMISWDRTVAVDAEITLEANPDDVTPESARAWHRLGINRISLGAQSFHPPTLAWMHRTHLAEQTARAVESLRAAGIVQLSLDLIFGLPVALGRDWQADLDTALALEPDHISLYGLTLEPHTPLFHWAERGEMIPVRDESYAEEYLAACGALAAAQYDHYEVSNAARDGARSRHNSAYWRRAAFLGLGPSAHSGFGRTRRWNIREWAAYARAAEAREPLVAGEEELDDEALRLEQLYLGLRTCEGLSSELLPEAAKVRWLGEGWATESEGRLRLQPEGWLRLDALVASVA